MANAIAMIAKCMKHSEQGYESVDLGLARETRADIDYIMEKGQRAGLPEEPMGHGDTSTEAQIEG